MTIDEALAKGGAGRFQKRLLAIFGLVWAADAMQVIAVGFAAQMIDGALGMAFGVISQTLLVAVLGVPPAAASASVHLVEMFTTGASGASHIWQRNIDWGLFRRLVPFAATSCFIPSDCASSRRWWAIR